MEVYLTSLGITGITVDLWVLPESFEILEHSQCTVSSYLTSLNVAILVVILHVGVQEWQFDIVGFSSI